MIFNIWKVHSFPRCFDHWLYWHLRWFDWPHLLLGVGLAGVSFACFFSLAVMDVVCSRIWGTQGSSLNFLRFCLGHSASMNAMTNDSAKSWCGWKQITPSAKHKPKLAVRLAAPCQLHLAGLLLQDSCWCSAAELSSLHCGSSLQALPRAGQCGTRACSCEETTMQASWIGKFGNLLAKIRLPCMEAHRSECSLPMKI